MTNNLWVLRDMALSQGLDLSPEELVYWGLESGDPVKEKLAGSPSSLATMVADLGLRIMIPRCSYAGSRAGSYYGSESHTMGGNPDMVFALKNSSREPDDRSIAWSKSRGREDRGILVQCRGSYSRGGGSVCLF